MLAPTHHRSPAPHRLVKLSTHTDRYHQHQQLVFVEQGQPKVL